MMNPNNLTEFFKKYLGAKYTWWHEGDPVGEEAPFYSLPVGSPIPTVEEVCVKGICCAGLLNLGRLFCGLEGCFGTITYEETFPWQEIPTMSSLKEGVILFRKYQNDEDQGHLAYMINETECIHSCDYDKTETGVCISKYEDWKHYFTHWTPFENVFT